MSAPTALPFEPAQRARADLKPGALYAIDGGDSLIYYGQVTPNKQLGFFRFRSQVVSVADALSSEVMCRFTVSHPSVGRALRSGAWLSLGRYELRDELVDDPMMVQWPVGTLKVTIWKGGEIVKTTEVHDPEIQHHEIIAAYDAVFHVPSRLRSDFEGGPEAWKAGGSIWRERRKKQELALRHPEMPWHQLPENWVWAENET